VLAASGLIVRVGQPAPTASVAQGNEPAPRPILSRDRCKGAVSGLAWLHRPSSGSDRFARSAARRRKPLPGLHEPAPLSNPSLLTCNYSEASLKFSYFRFC